MVESGRERRGVKYNRSEREVRNQSAPDCGGLSYAAGPSSHSTALLTDPNFNRYPYKKQMCLI